MKPYAAHKRHRKQGSGARSVPIKVRGEGDRSIDRAERKRARRWTGPEEGDWSSSLQTDLRAQVPPERWPFGPPHHHQPECRLHAGGLFCDCAASDASDEDWEHEP